MATSPSFITKPVLADSTTSGLQSPVGFKVDQLNSALFVNIVTGNTLPSTDGYYLFPNGYAGPLPLGVSLNDIAVRANAGATFALYTAYVDAPFWIRTNLDEIYQKSAQSSKWVYQGVGHKGVLDLTDQATSGQLNMGALLVDDYGLINVGQTTVGPVTLTIPLPANPVKGRFLVLNNTGNQTFSINGLNLDANKAANFIWDGDSWNLAGGGGGTSASASTIVTATANQVVDFLHNIYRADVSSATGGITFSLPAAGLSNVGASITFKKIDTTLNKVFINPNGTDTIDGETGVMIDYPNDSYTLLVSAAGKWEII
jgi:hypothetical protein